MDYEKKYNHALEVVRELQKDWASTQNRAAREIELAFPELRLAEDERMLKKIIEYLEMIKMGCVICTIDTSEEIAWLENQKELDKMIVVSPEVWDNAISDAFENGKKEGEKQKEQKPAWSEEDETRLTNIIMAIRAFYRCGREDLVDYVKSLRPQPKQMPEDWTDKDKRILDDISHLLISFKYTEMAKAYKQAIEKLLYSRPSWKPSKEQIYSLGTVVKGAGENSIGSIAYNLKELYEELKKL